MRIDIDFTEIEIKLQQMKLDEGTSDNFFNRLTKKGLSSYLQWKIKGSITSKGYVKLQQFLGVDLKQYIIDN